MSTQKPDRHKYLASREWALKREAVRERCGNICERCNLGPHQDTHHLTYEHFGSEPLEDLQGVCRPCHEWLSAKSDFDPCALIPGGSGDVVARFKAWGDSLPVTNPETFDTFNQYIQAAVCAVAGSNLELTIKLARVKLETNQRLYRALVEEVCGKA